MYNKYITYNKHYVCVLYRSSPDTIRLIIINNNVIITLLADLRVKTLTTLFIAWKQLISVYILEWANMIGRERERRIQLNIKSAHSRQKLGRGWSYTIHSLTDFTVILKQMGHTYLFFTLFEDRINVFYKIRDILGLHSLWRIIIKWLYNTLMCVIFTCFNQLYIAWPHCISGYP